MKLTFILLAGTFMVYGYALNLFRTKTYQLTKCTIDSCKSVEVSDKEACQTLVDNLDSKHEFYYCQEVSK